MHENSLISTSPVGRKVDQRRRGTTTETADTPEAKREWEPKSRDRVTASLFSLHGLVPAAGR